MKFFCYYFYNFVFEGHFGFLLICLIRVYVWSLSGDVNECELDDVMGLNERIDAKSDVRK